MLNTVDISNIFPPYLFSEITMYILLSIAVGYLLVKIIFKLISIKKYLRRNYLFLEIKPTARTLKSPLSTAQLFTILHSLEKPHHWLDKLLGLTKSISYELVSNKNDGIRFILRVGAEDAPSIRKTLLAYLPGIEIKEVDDLSISILIIKI